MSQLVADCPRCNTKKIAFDVLKGLIVKRQGWQLTWELFCNCGHCARTTVFVVALSDPIYRALDSDDSLVKMAGTINEFVNIVDYVSVKDRDTRVPPEFLPENIYAAFSEGAKCIAVGCNNAAGTMFRLCVDMTTKDKLPEEADGLNYKTRRDLGLRLPWLFDHGHLPNDLRELSTCIKEDGNDGAHQGTLTEADALDLLDFTEALLERIYTEPERLRQATERRRQRRSE